MHLNLNMQNRQFFNSATAVHSCSAKATKENLDDSRREYELLIQGGISKFKRYILNPMLDNLKLEPVIPPKIVVESINTETKKSTRYNLSEITTVGRMTSNLIQLDGEDISRVQCVIFIVGTKIMILDTWSLYGTITKHCKTRETYSSIQGKRNLIAYNIDETFELTIGSYNITINPDEDKIKSPHTEKTEEKCCICLDKPRTIRLPCGHACMCEDCAREVMASTAKCPICRASTRSIFHSACVESYVKT